MTTEVMFRKDTDGEIIAIFPYILGTLTPYSVTYFTKDSSHGHCDYHKLLRGTKPTKEPEYRELLAFLLTIDYTELKVITRISPQKMLQTFTEAQSRC